MILTDIINFFKNITNHISIQTELNDIRESSDKMRSSLSDLNEGTMRLSNEVRESYNAFVICTYTKGFNEAISDATNCLIWAKDIDGVIVAVNDNMRHSMGYFKNIKGMKDKDVLELYKNNFHNDPDDSDVIVLSNLLQMDNEVIEKNGPVTTIERGIFFNDKKVLRVRKNVIRNDSGEIIGICGVADDITEEVNLLNDSILLAENNDLRVNLEKIKYLFLDDANDGLRK